jgi:TonB family protein
VFARSFLSAAARVSALVAFATTAAIPTAARAAPPQIVPPQRLEAPRENEVPYPEGGIGDATVVLAIVVDESGAVTDVVVRQGGPPFADAAAAAVRSWRFSPATRDGAPVRARILATVTFHAPPPSPPAAPIAPPPAPKPNAGAPAAPAPPPILDVAVHGEREEPSTIHIPRSETQFVAGAFGDPLKVVEALPGMAPWLSGLPYYFVRGSPPENVGYFIDGIRVPLLFHVGPGASTIAPALVETVDLFPGAYPAEYGRYAGAVIAAKTTSPEMERPSGEFSARVYDANASIAAPFDGGKGSVLVAGRYSYTQLLTSIIVPKYGVGYWDYEARASHRVGSGTLTFFVFGAHDELSYLHQPTFHIEYHRADLRYDQPIAGGHLRVAGTFQYDDTLTALQADTGAGTSAALRGMGGRLRVEADARVASEARVRAGADVLATHYSIDDYPGFDGFHARSGPHTDVEGGAYADIVWRPEHAVEIVPGFRFDGYGTRGRTTWAPQPRLATRVQLLPWLSWLSALGTAHQEPTEEVYVPSKIPNPIDQSSQTIYQFSEGLDFRLPSSLHLRLAGFYTRLTAEHLVGTDLSGRGESGGLEVFVRREFTERLGGFVSYTLARTVGALGNTPATRTSWDRTHVLSVVLGYDLGNHWRIGARVFVESGRPWPATCTNCDPTTGATPAGQSAAFVTPAGNLPVFWRLDARLEKRWEFRGGAWLGATLECFNTFDKPEPTGDTWDAVHRKPVPDYQSPIILPSIGAEGGF